LVFIALQARIVDFYERPTLRHPIVCGDAQAGLFHPFASVFCDFDAPPEICNETLTPTGRSRPSRIQGMASYLNADLHCHSVASDGTLTPEALARRAKSAGVELWALTDHDEVSGQQRALAAARAEGLPYLTGVEISITFASQTVHVVGLGFDAADARLVAGLRQTRGGRTERAQDMSAQLAQAGIPGAYEGALKYVGNPELISRTHFARYLVEAGVCADTNEVFRRYLTEGKPGYIPHRWASLSDAVGWITGAGGAAVIAHPGRYKFTPNEEYALFSEFKQHGGAGVEVVTGSHLPSEYGKYADMAKEFGLAASRGSDFHSPDESRIDLGALPYLPGQLTPVWELLTERIHH
jgi:predicted metal-dependent phosphoesterase TrpH